MRAALTSEFFKGRPSKENLFTLYLPLINEVVNADLDHTQTTQLPLTHS